MRQYLKGLESYLQEVLAKPQEYDISALRRETLTQISFMQHERLIHLLVTILFAMLFLISLSLFLFFGSAGLLLLTILLLTLLIPYIAHYYFLENTVQKLYVLYNRIAALDDNTAYPNTAAGAKA